MITTTNTAMTAMSTPNTTSTVMQLTYDHAMELGDGTICRLTQQDTTTLANWGRALNELASIHEIDPLGGEKYRNGEYLDVYRPRDLRSLASKIGQFIIDQDLDQLSLALYKFMCEWKNLIRHINVEVSWITVWDNDNPEYEFLVPRQISREALEWEVHLLCTYCNKEEVNIPKFMFYLERAINRYERLFKDHYFAPAEWWE